MVGVVRDLSEGGADSQRGETTHGLPSSLYDLDNTSNSPNWTTDLQQLSLLEEGGVQLLEEGGMQLLGGEGAHLQGVEELAVGLGVLQLRVLLLLERQHCNKHRSRRPPQLKCERYLTLVPPLRGHVSGCLFSAGLAHKTQIVGRNFDVHLKNQLQ